MLPFEFRDHSKIISTAVNKMWYVWVIFKVFGSCVGNINMHVAVSVQKKLLLGPSVPSPGSLLGSFVFLGINRNVTCDQFTSILWFIFWRPCTRWTKSFNWECFKVFQKCVAKWWQFSWKTQTNTRSLHYLKMVTQGLCKRKFKMCSPLTINRSEGWTQG